MSQQLKHSEHTWLAHHKGVVSTASARRAQAQQLQERAQTLRRATSDHLDRHSKQVKTSLDRRRSEINTWWDRLEEAKAGCYTEIGRLLVAQDELTAQSDHIQVPIARTVKNQATRDNRTDIDLVDDYVDRALDAELAALRECEGRLQGTRNAVRTQLGHLRDCVRELDDDLDDKAVADRVDKSTTRLNTASTSLGLFRETVRPEPEQAVRHEDWKDSSAANLKLAAKEVLESKEIGQEVHLTLLRVDEAVRRECQAVDASFVRRLQETEDALARSVEQLARTREAVWAQEADMAELDEAVAAKQGPLALTTTRLQTRTSRPSRENVRDEVHRDLVTEADAIDRAVEALTIQRGRADTNLCDLEEAAATLQADIAVKKKSVVLDRSCIAARGLAARRKPRATDYGKARSVKEWCSYGRTRSVYIK